MPALTPSNPVPMRTKAIRRMLARYKVATTSQIRRVHYQGLTERSAKNLCHRNLQTLTELGLLKRRPYPYLESLRETEYLYSLTGRTATQHMMDEVELYVRFAEVLGPHVNYVPEPSCHIKVGTLTSNSDGLVELSETRKYFLEVDEDQEHPGELRRKMRHYEALYDAWDKNKHGPKFPLVIWVAHDPQRVADIAREIRGMKYPHIFTAIQFDDVVPRLTRVFTN